MKKINWINIIKFVVLAFCTGVVFHDTWLLTISCWITGKLYTFTWFGLITFGIAIAIVMGIHDDFERQLKSIQSKNPKHATDTISK